MTVSPAGLVRLAESDNGYLDGSAGPAPGWIDVANKFSTLLGHPVEAWCGDAVTGWFWEGGLKLPSMQAGLATGFAYCPAAYEWGRARGLIVPSWEAQPGFIALFDWGGDGVSDHTELVRGWAGGVLRTIGGNSGPSNVAGSAYRGRGGVHEHEWTAPAGTGNRQVLGVIDTSRLVPWGSVSAPPPGKPAPVPGAGVAPKWPGRLFALRSPLLAGTDVRAWQAELEHRGWRLAVDAVYGPASAGVCRQFQAQKGLLPDGIVGPITWRETWEAPITGA